MLRGVEPAGYIPRDAAVALLPAAGRAGSQWSLGATRDYRPPSCVALVAGCCAGGMGVEEAGAGQHDRESGVFCVDELLFMSGGALVRFVCRVRSLPLASCGRTPLGPPRSRRVPTLSSLVTCLDHGLFLARSTSPFRTLYTNNLVTRCNHPAAGASPPPARRRSSKSIITGSSR